MATKKASTTKASAAKKKKPVDNTKNETHPFGTCVPLGQCICGNKKETN